MLCYLSWFKLCLPVPSLLQGLLSQEKDYFQFTLASPVRLARETADPTLTTVTMVRGTDCNICCKKYRWFTHTVREYKYDEVDPALPSTTLPYTQQTQDIVGKMYKPAVTRNQMYGLSYI